MYSVGFASGTTREYGKILEALVNDTDFEGLMIYAGHVKVHPNAVGARVENQEMGCTKGELNTRIHLAVDAYGMPVRFFITSGGTRLHRMKYTRG